jgi:hypothetical protein
VSRDEALKRFTWCVLQSGVDVPYAAIGYGIAVCLQLVVHLERRHSCRLVTELVRVRRYDVAADTFDLESLHQSRRGDVRHGSGDAVCQVGKDLPVSSGLFPANGPTEHVALHKTKCLDELLISQCPVAMLTVEQRITRVPGTSICRRSRASGSRSASGASVPMLNAAW